MAVIRAWVDGLTVRTRFIAVVTVVLGLVALTFFGYYPRQLQDATRRSTEERARGLANTVAIGVAVGLELYDLSAITAAFDFARRDPDFVAVALRYPDGEMVGQFVEIDPNGSNVNQLQVVMPIDYRSEHLGEVLLAMSLDRMNASVAREQWTGILMCVGLLGVGILLTVVGARPITRPLAQLAAAADEVAEGRLDAQLPSRGANEVGRLAAAFEHMRQAVQHSLQRLTEQSAEMRLMLDHLEEGLFTFNPDLTINPQHSRRTPEILGVEDITAAPWSDLFPVDTQTQTAFRDWVHVMAGVRDERRLGPYGRLNPIEEFVRSTPDGPHYVRVICRPIVQGGEVRRFLVLVMDVTEQRRAQEKAERTARHQESDSVRVLALVRNDREETEDLLERCGALLTTLASSSGDSCSEGQIRREAHTLKGNAGSFGFSELSSALGAVEAAVYAESDARDRDAALARALDAARDELDRVDAWRAKLFTDQASRVDISGEAYQALIHELESSRNGGPANLLERLRYLAARPLGHYGRRYQRFVEGYRRTYGKSLADLAVLSPDVLILPDNMRTLDECIVQLLRNAADHGIEGDDERAAAGKGRGRISLSAQRVGETLEVTVADDGRGIDRDAVSRAAILAGVVTPDAAAQLSNEALVGLTLRAGVTTRSEANEISGRGMGLDVVAQVMRGAGGDVAIHTEVARGSRIVLRLPVRNRPLPSTRHEARHGADSDC